MLGRVLVLSASAGAGHLRAAEAVEKAIRLRGLASEVQHLDVLKYTNKVFRHFYSKAYIDLVNRAPEVLGWLYDYLDNPAKNDPIRLAFDRLNADPFIRFLKRYQADVAICTHFLPSGIISSLKAEKKIDVFNAVVVTDFDVHAMWLCHHVEQYFVALEETKVHMRALGIPDIAHHDFRDPNRSRFRGDLKTSGPCGGSMELIRIVSRFLFLQVDLAWACRSLAASSSPTRTPSTGYNGLWS